MVLLFYNPLPLGNKTVAFCSQKNRDLAYAQEAFQENMMALICQIPGKLHFYVFVGIVAQYIACRV